MTKRQAKPARECSAQMVNGRMGCGCLNGKPELRADLAVCHPRMVGLMGEAEVARLAAIAESYMREIER